MERSRHGFVEYVDDGRYCIVPRERVYQRHPQRGCFFLIGYYVFCYSFFNFPLFLFFALSAPQLYVLSAACNNEK